MGKDLIPSAHLTEQNRSVLLNVMFYFGQKEKVNKTGVPVVRQVARATGVSVNSVKRVCRDFKTGGRAYAIKQVTKKKTTDDKDKKSSDEEVTSSEEEIISDEEVTSSEEEITSPDIDIASSDQEGEPIQDKISGEDVDQEENKEVDGEIKFTEVQIKEERLEDHVNVTENNLDACVVKEEIE